MTSPRQSGFSAITPWSGAGGSSDIGGGVGRIGCRGGGLIERQLVVAGHRLGAYALELCLELGKISEVAIYGRKQEPAHRLTYYPFTIPPDPSAAVRTVPRNIAIPIYE